MAQFASFSNILPDPAHPINDAGALDTAGTPGPGFKSVGFTSSTDTQVSRTISGRGVSRDGGSHYWSFTIAYNPMFRYQFEPVDNFLIGRNPRKDPFYVILPQYSKPRDPVFTNWFTNTANKTANISETQAGANQLMLRFNSAVQGSLKPGDMFNIQDPNNFNHKKMYRIVGVETSSTYQSATVTPSTNQLRVRIAPPLERDVAANSLCVLIDPMFRVITKNDVQEYELNENGLYAFSLAVEEIQP